MARFHTVNDTFGARQDVPNAATRQLHRATALVTERRQAGTGLEQLVAADAHIRDRVAFVSAHAPFASMWTLFRDIASASRERVRR